MVFILGPHSYEAIVLSLIHDCTQRGLGYGAVYIDKKKTENAINFQ